MFQHKLTLGTLEIRIYSDQLKQCISLFEEDVDVMIHFQSTTKAMEKSTVSVSDIEIMRVELDHYVEFVGDGESEQVCMKFPKDFNVFNFISGPPWKVLEALLADSLNKLEPSARV